MKKEITPHRYTECGLPNIVIFGLHTIGDDGADLLVIPKVRSLHRLITRLIIETNSLLSGAELRFLRSEMELTPSQLAELVHHTPATLARWERGESQVDATTDALIRLLAVNQLGLDTIDPVAIAGQPKVTVDPHPPIHIKVTSRKEYRLAA